MIALPPPPVIEVQPVDYEIQAPDETATALKSLVVDLFGVQLNEEERILTLKPDFPLSWREKDATLTTADFEFSCKWNEHVCTWDFEGFGAYAESYDSIVVYVPNGTLLAGELADSEGVMVCYYAAATDDKQSAQDQKGQELTSKEKRALAKIEKELRKLEKKEAELRKKAEAYRKK